MFDIAIVGGGLVGCTFALDLALQRPDFQIVIIERNKPDFSAYENVLDNRIYAITPKNYKYLQTLGVSPNLSRISEIKSMHVRGNRDSQIILDAKEVDAAYLAKIAESANLHQAIYQELLEKCPNVQFKFLELVDIQEEEHTLVIKSDSEAAIYSRILIAADGARSFVRNKFNFKTENIPYYQSGIVANFKCELAHNNVASQWFLDSGILAYLPLNENKISIVYSANDVDSVMRLNDEEFSELISQIGNHTLGKLTLLNKPQVFPLQLNLVNKFSEGRIILIGDAAHTVHPLAGQGVNLGFGDSRELAKTLAKVDDLHNIDKFFFRRYNANRYLEVRKMQLTCHSLQRLFYNRLALVDKIRNFGLNLVNHSDLLKKTLINAAINY